MILKKVQELLKTATHNDLDKIKDCRVDLLIEWSTATLEAKKQKKRYELNRCKLYLDMKENKRASKGQKTDTEISSSAKFKALEHNNYEVDVEYARVLKEHLDELRSLSIEIMHKSKTDDILHYRNK